MTVLRTWQFLEITVLIFTITGCEGSPSSPSAGPHDIDLVGFSVTSMGNFAGFGPYYTVCGAITKSTDVTDEVVLHDLTTSIRDAGGLEILRWSDGGIFTRLGLAGGGLSGCFTSQSDPYPTRAVGSSFVVRVTYSRVTGPSRVAEVSGPVVARRPPA